MIVYTNFLIYFLDIKLVTPNTTFLGPGGVGSNFIAALSAKLNPTLSPRGSRRHSEDLGPNMNSTVIQQNKRGPGQIFLDSLNAKLAQQHISNPNSSPPQQYKANKIRQIINSKAQVINIFDVLEILNVDYI